ncbi:MAG: hypothetical protein WD894_15175 [Pirellulales bacterium]
MARHVYVETSVWGMLETGQIPTLREPTLEFFSRCEQKVFDACISDVVLLEISKAPEKTQREIIDWIARIRPLVLPVTADVDSLAQRFVDEGILPRRRMDDGRHVACAMVHELDLLVSWNYRHIANVRKSEGFNAVGVLSGYSRGLEIHTPLEVLEWT